MSCSFFSLPPLVWKPHCVFHFGLARWSFLHSLHPVSSAQACQPASVPPLCVQVPAASPRTLRLRSSRSVCDRPPPPHLPCLPLHFHTHSIYTAVAAPARWNVNLAPLVFAPTLISGLRLADGCLYSQVYPAVMQTPFLHLSRAEWCPCVNLPQSCFNLPVSCAVSSAVDSEQVESTHTKPQCYFETHLRTCRLSLAWKIGP